LKYCILLILFVAAVLNDSYSQDIGKDTLISRDTSVVRDTLKTDTLKKSKSDIDDIINYTAVDSAVFDIKNKKLYLFDNAEVVFKDLKLNSGIIVIDQEKQLLDAFGLPDSADENLFVQKPIMVQGTDKYEGIRLLYNFKTKQGSVSMGYSDADVGYYFGEKIKKVTPEVYFVKNGLYTTSTDKVDPEYYFYSPKMKIIPKDVVIAQSVFLYIEGVPVFWIPFAVLPNRSGRQSGLIVPTYGDDGTYGVYIAKLGYFWAMNDYMDLALTGSWFSKGRLDFNAMYRYAVRYKFTGALEGGYSRIRMGESKDKDKYTSDQWQFGLTHFHQITPTMRIDANLSFVSGKSYYDNSTNNLSDLLRQNVVSNFTLSKFWEETPFSMTLNYYRDQNLQNGDITERLPSLTFTVTETYPFSRGFTSGTGGKLYEYLSFSYNGQFLNNRTKRTIPSYAGIDSTVRDTKYGVKNNLNINFAPVFKYFNIRPYFYYTELWYDSYVTKYFNPLDSTVTVNNNKAFKFVRYFSTGVSMNTKFVGIFSPRILGVEAIRHTITPSVSYVYIPDFSDEKWGYYNSYYDARGNKIKYSIFENQVFGGAPMGESQAISMSLGNLLEMKTLINDTLENKFQLINFNLGANYNFAADSLKWSEIRADFRTQVGNLLNISGGASFNLYKYDFASGRRVNKFLWNEDRRLADMTSFNINISTAFGFDISNIGIFGSRAPLNLGIEERPRGQEKEVITPEEMEMRQRQLDSIEVLRKKSIMQRDDDEVDFNIPVSGGLNYNYSENRPNPSSIFRSSNLSGSLSFSIAQKWKFSFSAGYDFVNRLVTAPYITVYRDLSSWEANFSWYPTGFYRGFRLEIRIKAPELRDIRVTKQTNTRGAF